VRFWSGEELFPDACKRDRVKALVLSGGSGSRLRPITHTMAKQLVPVGNKPVLFHALEALARAGVRDVGLVVGETAAAVQQAVGDGTRFGVHVTYLPQPDPLGLAHAVLVGRDFLGDEPFVMYLGDIFLPGGLTSAVTEFRAAPSDARILVATAADPRQFGVVELDDSGRVARLVEKPEEPASDLVTVGVYIFGAAVHQVISGLKPSSRGELEITDAIDGLVEAGGRVELSRVAGPWRDTGSLAGLLAANRLALQQLTPLVQGQVVNSELTGAVSVAPGAEVRDSTIRGPVSIAPGAVVRDSQVGPYTSLDQDCWVVGSEIEESIVLPSAWVQNVRRVHSSLIGRDARVVSAARHGGRYRFFLGDHADVQLGP
jgi:glucose-1-phosphate thymidylyltransferase